MCFRQEVSLQGKTSAILPADEAYRPLLHAPAVVATKFTRHKSHWEFMDDSEKA